MILPLFLYLYILQYINKAYTLFYFNILWKKKKEVKENEYDITQHKTQT
jgi:hypothetical protein